MKFTKFSDSLDAKDVESVAKGRVSRAESKTTMYVLVGVVALFGVGLLMVNQGKTVLGFVLFALGAVGFFYYSNTLTKKQKALTAQLQSRWQMEKKQSLEQSNLDAAAVPK